MANRPRRIQRKRTKGWRLPENTVYVGRPTKWGNPHTAGPPGHQVTQYEKLLRLAGQNGIRYPFEELRGKNLACWCSLDQPCHADVLLELANIDAMESAAHG